MVDKHFDTEHAGHDRHEHTLTGELICHLPYAIFSVAISLGVLSFLMYFSLIMSSSNMVIKSGSSVLFHCFHFMHIVFAATGTLITFLRFSKNYFKALLVTLFSTMTFCTLSDAILPYLAGQLLGVKMHFHLCFLSELGNIVPFLVVGIINGFVMSRHHSSRQSLFSIFSHFIHIFISSFASVFYLVSQGFTDWYTQIGPVFFFLIIAVVVPCTFSDLVVPMTFAGVGKKDAKD